MKNPMTWLAPLMLIALPTAVLAEDVAAVVSWSQRVELGTPVSGVVRDVNVRPGQLVKRGEKLLALDDRGYRSEVSRRLAAHRHAVAMLEEAQREDERAIELYDRTVLSDFERNQALIALQAARSVAEAARAALVQARLDLEHSAVVAPFDGLVLAVDAAPGQSVVSELQSAALVTMADNRVYRARGQVDGAQANRLNAGTALRATVRGQDLSASVSHVGYEPVAQTGQGPRYELVAEIEPSEGQLLRVGETVILHLE